MTRFRMMAIVILVSASAVVFGPREAGAAFNVNLLTNGNAESGVLVANVGGFGMYSTPGWTNIAGNFEAETYSGGTPPNINPASPGPVDRGNLLFYGGNAALTVATQNLNVSDVASAIDAGIARVNLSGFFGGYADQDDNARLSLTFLGSNGNFLGADTIGGVLAADRNNISGLLFRSSSDLLMTGTRTIQATLTFTRFAGTFNNGAADNLDINLNTVPEPTSLLLSGIPAAIGLIWAARRRKSAR